MTTDDEIKPPFKEKIYQETLDEIAQAFTGYNPEGDNATIFNWSGFIQEGNLYACGAQDRIEQAVKLAIDKTDSEARAAERAKFQPTEVGKELLARRKHIEEVERQRCIENFKKVLSNLKEQQEKEHSRLGTPQQRIRNEGWLGCCSYLLDQLAKLSEKVE